MKAAKYTLLLVDDEPHVLASLRRLLRKEMEERGIALPVASRAAPMFVPAVLEEQEPSPPTVASKPASQRRSSRASAIELEIGGALVRIGHGADPDTISAVITALRGSSGRWCRRRWPRSSTMRSGSSAA